MAQVRDTLQVFVSTIMNIRYQYNVENCLATKLLACPIGVCPAESFINYIRWLVSWLVCW
jgi:hypothetical protein